MERPLISIVTVSLNASATIEKTILSVLSQSYTKIEYIIKDGGSTDGTLDIINKYKDNVKLIIEEDRGIYNAMNQGKNAANGDFLFFLGADDVLYDAKTIESIVPLLKHADRVYYGNVQHTSDGMIYDGEFNRWKWGYKNICHQSVFYPKDIYKSHDYCEKYKMVADWVYNLNLLKEKILFVYADIVVAKYNNISGISSNRDDNTFLNERRQLTIEAVGVMPYVYGLFKKTWNRLFA